jgi:hypothetical protein
MHPIAAAASASSMERSHTISVILLARVAHPPRNAFLLIAMARAGSKRPQAGNERPRAGNDGTCGKLPCRKPMG